MPYGVLNGSQVRPNWDALAIPSGSKIVGESRYAYWTWQVLGLIGPFTQRVLVEAFQNGRLDLITDEPTIDGGFENMWVVEGLDGIYMSHQQAQARNLSDGESVGLMLATYDRPVRGTPPLQYGFPCFPTVQIKTDWKANDLDDFVVIGLNTIIRHFDLYDYQQAIVTQSDGQRVLSHEHKTFSPLEPLRLQKASDCEIECVSIDGFRKTAFSS